MTSLEFSILTLNKTCKYGQFPLSFTIEREYKQEDRKGAVKGGPVFEFLFLHINTYVFLSDSVLFFMLAKSRGGGRGGLILPTLSLCLVTCYRHTQN